MAKLNKAQRTIIIAALLLVNVVWLFPPYKQPEVNEKGEITGWHVKWEFNKQFEKEMRGNPNREMVEYLGLPGLQFIEIVGILSLAGLTYLIAKKRQRES